MPRTHAVRVSQQQSSSRRGTASTSKAALSPTRPTLAQLEDKGVSTIPGGVKLCAVRQQRAHIVHCMGIEQQQQRWQRRQEKWVADGGARVFGRVHCAGRPSPRGGTGGRR
jgi:hypothetical protein